MSIAVMNKTETLKESCRGVMRQIVVSEHNKLLLARPLSSPLFKALLETKILRIHY